MTLVAAAILLGLSELATPRLVAPLAPGSTLGSAIAETGLSDATLRVQTLLQQTPREFPARGVLALTRYAFHNPWALPELAAHMAPPAGSETTPARCAATLAARAFGLPAPSGEGQGTLELSTPQRAIYALDFLLNEPSLQLRTAIAGSPAEQVTAEQVAAVLRAALHSTQRGAPRTDEVAAALAAAATIDRAVFVQILLHWDVQLVASGDWAAHEADEFPDELQGAIEGTVLTAQRVPELGWLVVGGPGPNRYDMSRIAGVFDPGGDDTYTWSGVVTGSHAIVDMAGNDTYTSNGVGGPAAAILGASLIIDAAGDDRYTGHTLAAGAAAFGVGLLVDTTGNDTYTTEQWGAGAALAGVGALIDCAGTDLYDAATLSQGVGGPSGFGLLLDWDGDDRYRADRSQPSAYGTPAAFLSFSQGCAFGYRIGAPGGVGALVDCAGNDRYECGEFGQGCGYFLGLGVLHDRGGDDLYVGNRYAQGAAAHQAFGVLRDEAGADIYHGVTAANQGAAWDMSAAMLVDMLGDDTYRGASLSQGAAAQQAIGVLYDAKGDDRYHAGVSSQGAAGANAYHWASTLCPSLGILWDRAGRNTFNRGRHDGERVRTGAAAATGAAGAAGTSGTAGGDDGHSQWGLFLTHE